MTVLLVHVSGKNTQDLERPGSKRDTNARLNAVRMHDTLACVQDLEVWHGTRRQVCLDEVVSAKLSGSSVNSRGVGNAKAQPSGVTAGR
ncbi:hypothetical protein E4U53_003834 [Claviceps sorghi]|nr:hypothetical protein E4U53_003834 [Claviceps sorghi]